MLITSVTHNNYDNLTELNHVYTSLSNLDGICNTTDKNDSSPSLGVYSDNLEVLIYVDYKDNDLSENDGQFRYFVVLNDVTKSYDENLHFIFDDSEIEFAISKFKTLYNTYFN